MSRIASKFEELRRKGEGALIAFITAGDPRPELTPRIAKTLVEHVDILEVGFPFSDPIADGPTIQAATDRALRAGTTPDVVLKAIREIRRASDVPLVGLSYFNIVLRPGLERFMQELSAAGGDGIIIPDLPLEEARGVRGVAEEHGIDLILLAAPTTPRERLEKICGESSGFVYLVSLLGVTGAREELSEGLKGLLWDAKRVSGGRIPLAVGFGISKPQHVAKALRGGADGVIVGSAFVDIIARNLKDERRMLRELGQFARRLKVATR